ncbi:hypothetical protein RhiJN_19547 [Ceratobasidium sp. AG-Ba]|nr:hypothetical protein RhiJN_19547 [Ceratobasidium sp. AG-Ba]QRW05599.1 hypothetical protein RhiLY_04598 [Ceratobasidium sp. AG-Ba]
MIAQRTIPAFRQLAQRRAVPFVGRRMESTAADKPKAKLTFRFGPKDVPIELWPMGAVVGAGIVGAGFAISRHFYKDEDLRLHRNVNPASK